MANFKASSSLFSVNLESDPDSTEDFCMDKALEIVRDYLVKKYSLISQPIIKLTDGQLLVLTSTADSPNTSLVCTVRTYLGKTRLVTINLEGAGSIDHDSGDFVSRKETFGINNSSMESIKNDLNGLFDASVERIPVLKRCNKVPIYFPSSDERVFEYDFDKEIINENSKYQNVKILSSPSIGNCLLLDNLQNLAESDLNYTHGIMDYGRKDYTNKDIVILGGGDGGLLHELIKEQPKFVTMIEIDPFVVDSCRQHLRGACGDTLDTLEGENYKVIIDDCLKYLDRFAAEGRMFDYVVMGSGCIGALNAYEKVLISLPFKVKFTQTMRWVPSFLENWVFYQIQLADDQSEQSKSE